MLTTTTMFQGNLTADPTLRYTTGGTPVAEFRVLVNNRIRTDAGDWIDGEPTAHNVKVYGRLAEASVDQLVKGSHVIVIGRTETIAWPDPETGEKRTTTRVFIDRNGTIGLALHNTRSTSDGGDSGIFAVVARQSALWSGVPLLLVAGDEMEQRLRSRSLGRFVRIQRTVAGAMAVISEPPLRLLARRLLPHDARSARTGRRHVIQACVGWGRADLARDAAAVSDELVSNGLRYSAEELILRLELRRGLLTVAVTDVNPTPATLTRTTGTEIPTGGFGLQIVSALSAIWGSSPTTTGGKTVWAVLR
jgi:single stranded DNA-binding protein